MNVLIPICMSKIDTLDFPIWVEFSIIDSTDNKMYFVEKLPVISTMSITDKSVFPINSVIECELLSSYENDVIKVKLPFGIESTDGDSTLLLRQHSVLTTT